MTAAEKATMALVEASETGTVLPALSAEEMRVTLSNAASLAEEVARIVRDNGLSKRFGTNAREYVFVEGWLTISRVQNEQTHTEVSQVFTDEHTGEQIIKAKAWLTDGHGNVINQADGFCSTGEDKWNGKPFYARASMAQTRALGKALRTRHAWVMVMAGYAPTPAEEMEGVVDEAEAPAPPPPKPVKHVDKIPAAQRVTVRKTKPEESKLNPPEPVEMPDGMEAIVIVGFGEVKDGRMGVRCVFSDNSEDWANSWSTTDQALIKEKVLAAKREAKDAGQDARKAGALFSAVIERKPKPDGVGEWVDIRELKEVGSE